MKDKAQIEKLILQLENIRDQEFVSPVMGALPTEGGPYRIVHDMMMRSREIAKAQIETLRWVLDDADQRESHG